MRIEFVFFLLVMNLVGFILMGVDKSKARKRQYRISERTLWMMAIFGGSVGVTVGMLYFRHKTKHLQFKYGLPLIVLIHIIGIVFVTQ
ncbi:DUF1294 domain-containing protein [Mesobacillus maritimus]|uniref:DUF1294 domain-containing protein n=2 Tax=Mesobacillus maritimus TaxID=1643336 RepID=A0ABS7K9V9_9BACI|nr:DUF1294 domain-containing protein [Mesobacillus maritimus]